MALYIGTKKEDGFLVFTLKGAAKLQKYTRAPKSSAQPVTTSLFEKNENSCQCRDIL